MPRQTFAFAITLGALLAAAAPVTSHAEPSGGAAMPTVVPAYSAAEVVRNHRPAGTTEVFRRAVTVDGVPGEWTRYARADGRNDHLGGEHFSTVTMAACWCCRWPGWWRTRWRARAKGPRRPHAARPSRRASNTKAAAKPRRAQVITPGRPMTWRRTRAAKAP